MGDINQLQDIRGMSLLNICSKINRSILNKTNKWIKQHNILEEQAIFAIAIRAQ